jgi:L-ascorbate metabolism protein UlaG (beta-lactamase superfamily)
MLREPRAPWPKRIAQPAVPPPALDGAAAVVTFIGHSTFLIQTQAGNILTDPMFSERAGPLNWIGPRRVRPPALHFEDLPAISIVLLSHNHYDHCDRATLRQLARRFDPLVVTPLENGRLVRSAGLRQIEELDWWQSSKASPLPITLTPARHFSARTPFDRNRALWSGFVVAAGAARIFFAGDTAYGPFFTDVGRRLGPIDVALLPIGAYEPRWFMQAVHMNPADAVQAHLDVEAWQSIGTREYFGPILGVHVYPDDNFDAVVAQAADVAPYALTGSIIAQDRAAIARATDALRFSAGNFYVNDKPTGAVVGQQPFGGARASGTNDKAGSIFNLIRWVNARTIKETLLPPADHRYPHMG